VTVRTEPPKAARATCLAADGLRAETDSMMGESVSKGRLRRVVRRDKAVGRKKGVGGDWGLEEIVEGEGLESRQ
jgi:hypothetical protein